MKISLSIISLLFSLLLSQTTVDYLSKEIEYNLTRTGSVEGIAVLAQKNRPVRSGGGLYGRPTSSANSQTSSDSILVVLKGSTNTNLNSASFYPLNQKNRQFVPSILPVPVNGTVRIQNSDPVYHNVFSLTSPNKFDVGRRPKGEHFDVVFEKPGIVDVFCDIHSNMHAIIYVLPEKTFAWKKIKSGDSFSFSDVPEGSYELTLYAVGYKESSISIVVKNGQTYQAGTITVNP